MTSIPIKRDFLTNCYAREGLQTVMSDLVQEYKAHGKPFSFLLIDIDHFKKYNDKFGHIHGDEALKYFSSSLRLYLQESECYPFRLGGDEFVVIFPRTTSQEAAYLAKKLERALKKRPFIYKDQLRVISFSGGIASYPDDGKTLEEMLESSDRAMYTSKKFGRGRTTQYKALPAIKVARFSILGVVGLLMVGVLFVAASMLFNKANFQQNIDLFKNDISYKVENYIEKIKTLDVLEVLKQFEKEKEPVVLKPIEGISKEPVIPLPTTTATVSPSDARVTIKLKSGGVVTGSILSEDENEIRLKFKTEYGEGSTRIPKSSIKEIERD